MVVINFSYIRQPAKANEKIPHQSSRTVTLATGKWTPEPHCSIKIDQIQQGFRAFVTPKKTKPLDLRDDRTPTTAPTTPTPTTPKKTLQCDGTGRPECIEISDSDEWSVSTMGDSVFDDAKPGGKRSPKAKHSNIMSGSF